MSTRKYKQDINEMLLEAHRKGIEQAIDLSIRTGVPLVIQEKGEIREIKPKYRYVCIPIDEPDKLLAN